MPSFTLDVLYYSNSLSPGHTHVLRILLTVDLGSAGSTNDKSLRADRAGGTALRADSPVMIHDFSRSI